MVNRVVPAQDLDETALRLARHIAAIDPKLVKETKRAINRSLEAQGMLEALEDGPRHRPADRGRGLAGQASPLWTSPDRDGLKAALAWRDARFPRG